MLIECVYIDTNRLQKHISLSRVFPGTVVVIGHFNDLAKVSHVDFPSTIVSLSNIPQVICLSKACVSASVL